MEQRVWETIRQTEPERYKELTRLKQCAEEIFGLLKDTPSIEVFPKELNRCEYDEDVLVIGNMDVMVIRTIEKVETLLGMETVTSWVVEITVIEHNYPHEPDWMEPVEIGKRRGIDQIVTLAFQTYVSRLVDNTCENLGMDWIYHDRQEEDKLLNESMLIPVR